MFQFRLHRNIASAVLFAILGLLSNWPVQAEPTPDAPVMVASAAPDLPVAPREVSINEVSYQVAPQIRYPTYARDRGITGKVIVRVLVGEDGSVEQVSIVQSMHRVLNDAASLAVRKAKFRPYKINGKAVKVYVNIPFNFQLSA